jgi:hypothetical protein
LPSPFAHSPPPKINAPKDALGLNLGGDYMVANYTQLDAHWKKLAGESDRMKLVRIGKTEEGRDQWMAILAEGVAEEGAHALAAEGKAVVWIDGGLQASESVASQQLMEAVCQLASRTDSEALRSLNDAIVLCVQANPDGRGQLARARRRKARWPAARSAGGVRLLRRGWADALPPDSGIWRVRHDPGLRAALRLG